MDRLTVILIVVGALSGLLLVLWLSVRNHRRGNRQWRLWSQVAEKLGGAVRPRENSVFVADELHMLASIEGVDIELMGRLSPKALRNPTEMGTEVRASVVGTSELTLSVESKVLENVDTIDFSTDNVDLARAWLSEDICLEIAACRPYQFLILKGTVTAARESLEDDILLLECVAKTVAHLALGSVDILRRTKTMVAEVGGLLSARSSCWEPDGGVLAVIELQGTQVLLDSVLRHNCGGVDNHVFTRVRVRPFMTSEAHFVIHGHQCCEPPAELADLPLLSHDDMGFSQSFTVLARDELGFAEQLSTAVRQRIQGLRPALVTSDGHEITVLLKGIVLEAQVVIDAMDLAVDLATSRPSNPSI